MDRMKEVQVVVAGHVCLDITPSFKRNTGMEPDEIKLKELFSPGKLVNVGRVNISAGGPVSNTGIALKILGINTSLMGKIGNDYFGQGVAGIFRERNLQDGLIVVNGEETSYTVVIVPPGFDRIFLHNPGANDTFCADDINYDIIQKARIFHFGYPPLMKKMYENGGKELLHIFKSVKSYGVTTSLDMSLPDASSESGTVDWDGLLTDILPYVDIFIPSIEETVYMLRRPDYDALNKNNDARDITESFDVNMLQELGSRILSYGAKVAAIKCGIRGYYIRTGSSETLAEMGTAVPADLRDWSDRELLEESFYVPDAVSAIGAGDTSIAGFLAAMLNGKSIEECIRIACAVGAQNIRTLDAVSGIGSWNETLEMAGKHLKKNRLSIKGSYWKYNSNKRLWAGEKDRAYGRRHL